MICIFNEEKVRALSVCSLFSSLQNLRTTDANQCKLIKQKNSSSQAVEKSN